MGVINCDIHGEEVGVIPWVSQDIVRAIDAGQLMNPSEVITIHVFYYDDEEGDPVFMFDTRYYFSKKLQKELGLGTRYDIVTDEDDEKFTKLVHPYLGVICGQCFRDYMGKIGVSSAL